MQLQAIHLLVPRKQMPFTAPTAANIGYYKVFSHKYNSVMLSEAEASQYQLLRPTALFRHVHGRFRMCRV